MSTRTRGSNFSVAEEKQLCFSYITIGKDATVGTNQSSGTFWERIWQDFEKGMGPGSEERSLRSLESKWATTNAEVSKFVGAMATVRARPQSGESAEDQIARATKAYHALSATKPAANEDENSSRPQKKRKASKGKDEFKYLHCWRILETEPKWQTFREQSPTEVPQPGPAIVQLPKGYDRPGGVKNTKEEAKRAASLEATYKRLAAAAVHLAKSSANRVKALEDANNLVLFSTPVTTLDPVAQRFFNLRHAAVLRALEDDQPTQVVPQDQEGVVSDPSIQVTAETDGEVAQDHPASADAVNHQT